MNDYDSGVSCNINNTFLNYLIYADDMCILAPSVTALQYLLNICFGYAEAQDMKYKSVCMHIKCMKFKMRVVHSVYLGDNILQYVYIYKYLGCIITDKFYVIMIILK